MDDTLYRARVCAVPSTSYRKVARRGRGDTCSVECRVDLVSWLVRTYSTYYVVAMWNWKHRLPTGQTHTHRRGTEPDRGAYPGRSIIRALLLSLCLSRRLCHDIAFLHLRGRAGSLARPHEDGVVRIRVDNLGAGGDAEQPRRWQVHRARAYREQVELEVVRKVGRQPEMEDLESAE